MDNVISLDEVIESIKMVDWEFFFFFVNELLKPICDYVLNITANNYVLWSYMFLWWYVI